MAGVGEIKSGNMPPTLTGDREQDKPKSPQHVDANRAREARCLDEIQGVMANTLKLLRIGASLLAKTFGVGFIDWLGFPECIETSESRFSDLEVHGLLGDASPAEPRRY